MTSGKPDYTRSVSIVGYTIESLPIDIVAQTVGNVTIDIAAQSMGNIDINIAASAVTLDFNLKSSDITLDVDVTAQSVGDISIDIAAQSVGNLDVDIKAQTVDLNIKTSGGANIVIDELTQTAYLERRSTLSNHGASASYASMTGTTRRGKFFPRGCRGFLNAATLNCKDDGAAGGTITVYLSPYIGAGYVRTGTITVPAGGAADWRNASILKMWEYDSLFVWWVCSSADIKVGYDSGEPYDSHFSTDSGATWNQDSYRFWVRVYMRALSVGDLPVSGTLNTIPISLAAAEHVDDSVAITVNVETTIISVDGMGYCEYIRFHAHEEADSHVTFIEVRCDGVEAYHKSLSTMSSDGFTTSTPGVSLTAYAENGRCVCVLTTRFEFTRLFEVAAVNYISDGLVSVDAIVHTLT